jgi:penicillin-binding protein 1C
LRTSYLLWLILFCSVGFYKLLPPRLFNEPLSIVLEDAHGQLLGARIARDGQWRFPEPDSVPYKFKEALLQFEDNRFPYHLGIDPLSIGRAVWLNLKNGRIVSGGSTLTMQIARISRGNPPRTFVEKIYEIFLSIRIELGYSKAAILKMYATHAPFGGNVVGIESAAWRYFALRPHQLSWAESCTLAVLPNSPALIHPGRNRKRLAQKRNRLLKTLCEKGIIDNETYELSIDEPIPVEPRPFPNLAPHLLEHGKSSLSETSYRIRTTLDAELQTTINQILKRHHEQLVQNQVYNIAALVIESRTGKAKAYIGNYYDANDKTNNGYHVDVIRAPRSTGSILKPFLYTAMLTEGQILPSSLIPDVPLYIGNFAPKNFSLSFDGAVPADKALSRSLNVPAVFMLRDYTVAKFHTCLQRTGFSTLTKPPRYYGLSLVLGGAEGTLWDITGMYASLARNLMYYNNNHGAYLEGNIHPPSIYPNDEEPPNNESNDAYIGAAATWYTFRAMLEVERPGEDNQWRAFSSSKKIAWKTGTSFGFRDAWAVGITPDYVVGVWVGNADGEGRPGIIGAHAAAPVLFDIFDQLKCPSPWFQMPKTDMIQLKVCKKSGFIAGPNCEETTNQWLPKTAERSDVCPYHKLIHTDLAQKYQVSLSCELPDKVLDKKWFVLPPLMGKFYKNTNSNYKPLPPWRTDCLQGLEKSIDIVYPQGFTQIFLPRGLDGKKSQIVLEVATRKSDATVYWHIDNQYIGSTQIYHQISVQPSIGKHTLTVTDGDGFSAECSFEVLEDPAK